MQIFWILTCLPATMQVLMLRVTVQDKPQIKTVRQLSPRWLLF